MAWIKRNLYFVITVVVALGLTIYCGVLLFAAVEASAKAKQEYEQSTTNLSLLKNAKPYPSPENIQMAEDDAVRVRAFLADFRKPFAGFPTPPQLDNQQFKEYLQKTIYQFGADATNAGVGLEAGYSFGFGTWLSKLNYPAECIAPWMQELQEMKAILDIFYHAKINYLLKIQRPVVAESDTGQSDDYTRTGTLTNLSVNAIVTPYVVQFRAFSSEIANVLAGIAASSNCFIVRNITVTRANYQAPAAPPTPTTPAPAPPVYAPPIRRPPPSNPDDPFGGGTPGGRRVGPGPGGFNPSRPPPPSYPQGTTVPAAPSVPVTILTEVPLFVTIYIDVEKLRATEAPVPKPRGRTPEH
jgi:hypothetical protein